eukprot:4212250-Prymnesium_polylepis.1
MSKRCVVPEQCQCSAGARRLQTDQGEARDEGGARLHVRRGRVGERESCRLRVAAARHPDGVGCLPAIKQSSNQYPLLVTQMASD